MLRTILRHAADSSPWHRNRIAGFDIDHVSGDDLSGLPTMTKADLMDNWDAVVTDPAVSLGDAQSVLDAHTAGEPFQFLHNGYVVVATGGSTGARGVIVHDEYSLAANFGSDMAMGRAQDAARLLPPLEVTGPPKMARLNATNPVHVSAVIPAILGSDTGQDFKSISPATPIPDGVETLNTFQPHILVGYPSLLEVYALEARASRLSIKPGRIASIGEPLTAEVKATIEATWNVPVANAYAASEGFSARSWGGSSQLYQPDDVVIMELVDDDNQRVAPGVESTKVLITNLHNRIQPLIRYEISDRVSSAQPPADCSWQGQWINPPQGRQDDVFTYGADGNILAHPHLFRTALLADPAILSYQVHQTTRGSDLRVVAAGAATIDAAALSARVTTDLRRAGMKDPLVNVKVVPHLEHHANSGKLRRFVPLTDKV